jgi:hypothetical protein
MLKSNQERVYAVNHYKLWVLNSKSGPLKIFIHLDDNIDKIF